MAKRLFVLAFLSAMIAPLGGPSFAASPMSDKPIPQASSSPSVNPVVEWNRTLLTIVRTKGAQPATIHPTRSFAMMHAAIYDAVNAIDGTHRPYLLATTASPTASQEAAADQAAHDVLVSLYPTFQNSLDSELQQDLAQIPDSTDKRAASQSDRLPHLRSSGRANDGSIGVRRPR